VVLATVGVWRGITEQPRVREVESPILLPNAGKRKTVIEEPRPPYFRPKLLGIAAISLMLLSLPSYFVRRCAAASVRDVCLSCSYRRIDGV
jgi:hypothetical protein